MQETQDSVKSQLPASTSRVIEVREIEGSDELFVEFPPEMMQEMGWLVGDELVWHFEESNEGSSTRCVVSNSSLAVRQVRTAAGASHES